MRFSDVKVGYIYNVIFDPVRDCEFDGKHLAVVLKKIMIKRLLLLCLLLLPQVVMVLTKLS